MIDWHSHILPGVDDGPADIEESVAIAKALAAGGFTEVYCTPHLMRGCYETGNDEVRRGVARLQERLDASGIPITLRSGREYCLDEYLQDALEDPLPLGDSRLLLVEILPHSTADMVSRLLYDVVRAGFTPVVAHPERSPLLVPPAPPGGQRRHPGGPSPPVSRQGETGIQCMHRVATGTGNACRKAPPKTRSSRTFATSAAPSRATSGASAASTAAR